MYPEPLAEVVRENQRRASQILREKQQNHQKSGYVEELDAMVQRMAQERSERREMLKQLGVAKDRAHP